jgi:tetratricopeptide (TPR) repeat protein
MLRKKIIFAIVFYSAIIATIFANTNAEDHLRYLQSLYSQRDFSNAFIHANQIMSEYPNSPESFDARIILCNIHIDRGFYSEARMQLVLLLSNPYQMNFAQRARAFYSLGLAFSGEGNFVEAIESYNRLFLDYRDTPEAIRAIPHYFDTLYLFRDFQTMIGRSRELQRHYRDAEVLSELLYHQVRGYIGANMTDLANRTITEITTRYAHTNAATRAIELQILLHEKEHGKQSAATRLEQVLANITSREMEERLTWMLVNYYMDLSQTDRARGHLDQLIRKFNLSDNLSQYYILWLRLNIADNNIREIASREEHIIASSQNRPEYPAIKYFLAQAHTIAMNYWIARSYLDETINDVQADTLRFDYQFLYADIFIAQGQYMNSIEIYYSLLNHFSNLGRNYDIYIKLGDIYLLHLNQPTTALNFYRQAESLAKGIEQTSAVLLLQSRCLEATQQYSEALNTLTQIPLEKVRDIRQRNTIAQKITLLQIFYASDIRSALSAYFTQRPGSAQSQIDNARVLALDLKQWDDALNLLKSENTNEMRLERIKYYFLFAYRHILEGNNAQADSYTALMTSERGQIGRGLSNHDQNLVNTLADFINNRGKLSSRYISTAMSYINAPVTSTSGLCFKNFFAYQLFLYYLENNMTTELLAIAPRITTDSFIRDHDIQRVNVITAGIYFQQRQYAQAENHFLRAQRYLTLAYPEYYFQYAMCLYHTHSRNRALDILQRIVRNYADQEDLAEAKNIVIAHWLETPHLLSEALDILNQIPLHRRTDTDYRFLAVIFQRIGEPFAEKNAITLIRNKSWDERQRLAVLHHITGDTELAEYSWNEILNSSDDNIHKLNAHAYLAHISYQAENYAEAITRYERFFSLYRPNMGIQGLILLPETVAKELVISCYLAGNRPKAESHSRTHASLLRDNAIQAEIKLAEAIYYVRVDPRRANRSLTQLIEDGKTPAEVAYKALYYRAVTHIQDRKPDLAERDFLTALNTADPKLKNLIRLSFGNFMLSIEKPEEALELYYQVIVHDVDGKLAKDAAHNFALTARQLQDWERAISAYKIIMDRWGQTALSEETRLTIGFCFYQARHFDQAINLLEQLMDDLTTNALRAECLYWIAEAHAGRGAYQQAEASFNAIKSRFPREERWATLSQYKIAEMYHLRGEIEHAQALFREIIRVYGAGSDVGREARKYLEL